MQAFKRWLSREEGFSIIEVLVASSIMLVGLTGTMTMMTQADSATVASKAREGATNLQRELIEAARAIPYDNLTLNSIGPRVRAQAGLGDSALNSAGWTVRRRGMTYTVSMGVCAVDDPRDGIGAHSAGVFCATGGGSTTASQCLNLLRTPTSAGLPGDGAPATTAAGDCGIDSNFDGIVDNLVDNVGTTCTGTCDTNPADYKRIVSLVRWDRGAGARYVLQSATIANPGTAAAPTVSALTASPQNPVVSATSVSFTATVSPAPATVSWYLDGTQQTPATGSGATWTFSWALGAVSAGAQPNNGEIVDGSYLIGAKAFDQYGLPGNQRSVTVVLNRRAPYAPQNPEGGRNAGIVDLQWSPNKERDIEGYRAYRLGAAGALTEVCALTSQTACQDKTPPAGPSIQYFVVAVDRDPQNALREGDRSATVTVKDTNTPPPPPASLSSSTSAGNTLLVWTAPATPDPDPGDYVDHFVIYRDGKLFADRYDRTATASELSFTDTHTNGLVHTYWVASVDTQLAESTFVGPVTR